MKINWHTEALNWMKANEIPHAELPCGFIERAMQHGAKLMADHSVELVSTAMNELQRRHESSNPTNSGMTKTIEAP